MEILYCTYTVTVKDWPIFFLFHMQLIITRLENTEYEGKVIDIGIRGNNDETKQPKVMSREMISTCEILNSFSHISKK